MRVRLLTHLRCDTGDYAPGDELDVSGWPAEQVAALLAAGSAEGVAGKRPRRPPAGNGPGEGPGEEPGE